MTDQQRYDALSCHDGWIQTPNLDKLAQRGADLRENRSQAPVCVPSRCSIFTGRYPHSHGVLENDRNLPVSEQHLPRLLKENGFRVSYAGKNHLLSDEQMELYADRFDDVYGAMDHPDYKAYHEVEKSSIERLNTVGSYASAEFHEFPDEVTSTGRTANKALEYLAESPEDAPWGIVVSFSDPHVPHLAPKRFSSLYPLESMQIPDIPECDVADKHPRVAIKKEAQGSLKASDDEKRLYLSVYGSMCSFIDEQIGRILQALEERSDAERTIVVFVSDHGDFCWKHGMCKKDLLLLDDLLHVPAILSYPPEIMPQVVDTTFTETIDVFPTLLELANIEVPLACEGRSLLPYLKGVTTAHRDGTQAEVCYPHMRSGYADLNEFLDAWEAARSQPDTALGRSTPYNVPGDYTKSIRSREWKYIWYSDGFEELYRVTNDKAEHRNLAGEPEYASVLNELREATLAWSPDVRESEVADA